MNTAQPNNSEKLLTLQEAAVRLNVPVETLLSWNEHNILKPIITKTGAVGYTEHQLTQFSSTIQKIIQHANPSMHAVAPSTPAIQQQIQGNEPRSVIAADVPRSVETNNSDASNSDDDDIRQFSSKRMLVFAILLILLTSVFTQSDSVDSSDPSQENKKPLRNVLGMNTSTLNLSGNPFSSLPIQISHNNASEKALQNEQANAFREKTIASSLYSSKTDISDGQNKSSTVTAKKTPDYNPDRKITVNPNSYAATALFQSASDETSAIDEHGNIRGAAEEETLAMVVGSIDEKIKTDSLQQASTHATNQLLLIFLGMFAVLFGLQKQLAFVHHPGRRTVPIQPVYSETASIQTNKVLEVTQKTDGTIMLSIDGTEYKISKPEMNSESDQFIEKLMTLTYPDLKEIEYDAATAGTIRFATPLSRLVTRLGFVGIKRDLFFPRTSKTSVLFRRYLTKQDLMDMNITLDHIKNELDLLS